MEIRRVTEADALVWWALRLRALREHPEAFGSDYAEARTRPLAQATAFLREDPDSADDFVLGAFAEELLLGTIGFRRERGVKQHHKGDIWGVYVAPEGRGQGVARALLDATLARARILPGLEQILLSVVTENAAALALYRASGFTTYGIAPRALQIAGRYYDEALMALQLRE